MLNKRVVLVADRIAAHKSASWDDKSLEVVSDNYYYPLMDALRAVADDVIHYLSPQEFTDNISKHRNDVVLSIWSGVESRSRRTLMPAVCEANQIIYVGADAYLNAICQDKDLSKAVCAKYGIESPKGFLLYNTNNLLKLRTMEYPIIIKPNFEGGSIGIFSNNVAWNYEDACALVTEMITAYSPILAEEMVPGQEVYICVAGTSKHIDVFQAVRQLQNGKEDLGYEIVSAEYKKITDEFQDWDIVTSSIAASLKRKIEAFYFNMGKVEIIRIDGRLNHEGFKMIEISPDVGLSTTSTMTQAFEASGHTYEEMLDIILNNSVREWEYQNASRL